MESLRFRVPETARGLRLDQAIAARDEIASRSEAEGLIASGAVRVDGQPRGKSHRLEGGEQIDVEMAPKAALAAEAMPLTIVYEDEHLLVVDKPARLVVHPAGVRSSGTGTLVHGLIGRGARGGDPARPGIVHRLDRDTSGLLVVTRSEDAHTRMSTLLRRRAIERRYLTLVHGELRSRSGRIIAPIGRDRSDRLRHSLDSATPRDAVTWFETLEIIAPRALLEVRLETGRTHQIRVHLEAIDLPVCGDPVYGVRGDLGLERQFLHAHRLGFRHPFTGDDLDLVAPLPEDLEQALERARPGSGSDDS